MSYKAALLSIGAVLGMASQPVWCQSSVSIKGLLDIGVLSDFDRAKGIGTIQRSNVALVGSEKLGDGLNAIFRLSTRLDLDTGSNEGAGFKPFLHDESTVGLQGNAGTLRLGRALTAMWAQDWKFDSWANFNRIASPAWQQWHYLTPSDPLGNNGRREYGRLNNGIFYDSPNLGGVTVRLSGSPERQAPQGDRGRPYSAVLDYGRNAVAAMLAFERNALGSTDTFVAAKYDFGRAAVMVAYDDSRAFDDSDRSRAATAGATYRTGQVTWKAGYGRQRVNAGIQRFASLGMDYALSKRTIVHHSIGHKRDAHQPPRTAVGVGVAHVF